MSQVHKDDAEFASSAEKKDTNNIDLSTMIRNVAICGDYATGKTTLTNLLLGTTISTTYINNTTKTNIKTINNDDNNNNHDHDDDQKNCKNNDDEEYNEYKTHLYSKNIKQKDDEENDREFTINLMDCPGRLESNSEVNTALRLSDGCLLVASLVGSNGLSCHSEMVLRQAVATEKLKSILMINKLDVLLRSKCSLEDIYQSIVGIIESVNVVICTYSEGNYDSAQVYPNQGQVVFGSVLGEWAFTLKDFAKVYSKQFGMSVDEMVGKLWGDHYYDSVSGKWLNNSQKETLERGFCQFVLKPIRNILKAKSELLEELIKPFGIEISSTESQLEKEELTESILKKWLPASKVLLDTIYHQLPSPNKAQFNRVENIYTGDQEDVFGRAIKNCDPCGPLMMHVTRCDILDGKVNAIGRIFSGKLTMETPIRILGVRNTVFEDKTITGIVKINGSSVEQIQEATCGSIVGLQGIEKLLTNTGATISESSNLEAQPFSELKFQNAMINFSVEPENQATLPQVIKGMELISKCDPSMQFSLDEYTGSKFVSASSEIQLQSILRKFKQLHPSIELKVEEPIINYQEGITTESNQETLIKSPNKHNRFYMRAEPLDEGLAHEIENGLLPEMNRNKHLTDHYGWSPEDAVKIWTFGPFSNSSNVFVDQTKGVCTVNEIKDSSIAGFNFAMREGPLCAELVRNVRINLKDLTTVSDCIHRGAGQIIPSVRRGCHACILDSNPTLMEPVLLGEFRCKESNLSVLYSTLNKRRAMVMEQIEWHSICQTKAFVPLVEYFGLCEELNKSEIFSQFMFDHWQPRPLFSESNGWEEFIYKIRYRKGLDAPIPIYSELADRL